MVHSPMSDGQKKTTKGGEAPPEFPIAPFKRLVNEQAGGYRISFDGIRLLIRIAADTVRDVIDAARTYTEARGRKTISAEDIERGYASVTNN
jgi:histone H3/H4